MYIVTIYSSWVNLSESSVKDGGKTLTNCQVGKMADFITLAPKHGSKVGKIKYSARKLSMRGKLRFGCPAQYNTEMSIDDALNLFHDLIDDFGFEEYDDKET